MSRQNGHKPKHGSNGHKETDAPAPGSRGQPTQQQTPREQLLQQFTDADVDATTERLNPNLASANLARSNVSPEEVEEARHLSRAYREIVRCFTPTDRCQWTGAYGAALLGEAEGEAAGPDDVERLSLDVSHHLIAPWRATLSEGGFGIEKVADSHAEQVQRRVIEEDDSGGGLLSEVFS